MFSFLSAIFFLFILVSFLTVGTIIFTDKESIDLFTTDIICFLSELTAIGVGSGEDRFGPW